MMKHIFFQNIYIFFLFFLYFFNFCWGEVCMTCLLSSIVPPKLSPFGPPLSLHVGERASMTCSVVSGDQPLSLLWLKDGRPLSQPVDPMAGPVVGPMAGGRPQGRAQGRGQLGQGHQAGPRVIQNRVDQYNSILLIESLSPEHNGSYTCSASNQAAEVSQAQELLVNGTPFISSRHARLSLHAGSRAGLGLAGPRGRPVGGYEAARGAGRGAGGSGQHGCVEVSSVSRPRPASSPPSPRHR